MYGWKTWSSHYMYFAMLPASEPPNRQRHTWSMLWMSLSSHLRPRTWGTHWLIHKVRATVLRRIVCACNSKKYEILLEHFLLIYPLHWISRFSNFNTPSMHEPNLHPELWAVCIRVARTMFSIGSWKAFEWIGQSPPSRQGRPAARNASFARTWL